MDEWTVGEHKSDVAVVVASETGRNVELKNSTIGLLFITYTFFFGGSVR